MAKTMRLAAALLILFLLSTIAAAAQPALPASSSSVSPSVEVQGANELPDLWFVEMPSAPTADGTSAAIVRQEKDTFRSNARAAGLRYTERYAFDTLWNGLSIRIDRSQVGALTRLDGVKAIYPVQAISVPPMTQADPNLVSALQMTGADIVQNELGFTGVGIRVAVMDTGVDYDHPDLGGSGVQQFNSPAFPNSRVVTGWDLVGDAYNADPSSPAYNVTPAPDTFPDDCYGHGTHVAGIIGANGGAKGVAPGVSFGSYRVFGCSGSTTSDIMIAAMERALADKMQVLNMSIGSSFQWPQYPTAQASDRLVNKGVVVVASIGNSGTSGLYAAGAPGVGNKVIGVASFDNIRTNLAAFSVAPGGTKYGYVTATGAPPPPVTGSAPVKEMANLGCYALPAGSLSGSIALVQRGSLPGMTCSFYLKAINAQNAGAIGVVLYNNTSGIVSPTVVGTLPITIPVVSISMSDGQAIKALLTPGPVTLTWTSDTVSLVNATGGQISSFSSFGLAADLSLKPDIGAPGGSIRSTLPIEQGSYGNMSGTSMASPHVAGAVALLLQAKPNTSPQTVRTILQNSAVPKPRAGTPAGLDNVHRQGAGLLDIADAILATTKIEPGKLSLGESQAGPQTRTLSIENKSSAAVTYNLSNEGALATGPSTFTPTFLAQYATVAFSAPSITVPAGGTGSVTVTITAPDGLADRSLYGGYVKFTPAAGGQIYRVPYAGFKGDYQSIPVLTGGFPYLGVLTSCVGPLRGNDCYGTGSYGVFTGPGAVFTFQSALNQTPYILVHLDHQVRRLRVQVFEANTNKAWHTAIEEEYLGRNSTASSFFAYPWDGTTKGGNKVYTVPNGQYYFKLSIEKALGDDNNPAHWETWSSPVFTLARP